MARIAISRRGFFRSGVVAGVLAATGMPLTAQQRGGTLRLALDGNDVGTLFSGSVLGAGAIYDCLTEIAPSGELRGELATNWESSQSGRVWTLSLRPGVLFHDGRPFRSEDAVASLMRLSTHPHLLQIETVERGGDGDVRIGLTGPNPDFPFLLAHPDLLMTPAGLPPGPGVPGTGLYAPENVFEAGVAVSGMTLRRVQRHYKDGLAGWVDRIEILALAEPEERAELLRTGRVDVAEATGPGPRGAQLCVTPNASMLWLEADGSDPRAVHPMLMRALACAVDRPALLQGLNGGRGTIGADHPVPPGHVLVDSALQSPSCDPAAAESLLARSGLLGLPVEIRVSGSQPVLGRAAEQLSIQLQSAGFGLAHHGALSLTLGLAPASLTDEGAFSSWPDMTSDMRYSAALASMRADTDAMSRAARSGALQARLAGSGRRLVLLWLDQIDGLGPRIVRPDAINTTAPLDGGRLIERWSLV